MGNADRVGIAIPAAVYYEWFNCLYIDFLIPEGRFPFYGQYVTHSWKIL